MDLFNGREMVVLNVSIHESHDQVVLTGYMCLKSHLVYGEKAFGLSDGSIEPNPRRDF